MNIELIGSKNPRPCALLGRVLRVLSLFMHINWQAIRKLLSSVCNVQYWVPVPPWITMLFKQKRQPRVVSTNELFIDNEQTHTHTHNNTRKTHTDTRIHFCTITDYFVNSTHSGWALCANILWKTNPIKLMQLQTELGVEEVILLRRGGGSFHEERPYETSKAQDTISFLCWKFNYALKLASFPPCLSLHFVLSSLFIFSSTLLFLSI